MIKQHLTLRNLLSITRHIFLIEIDKNKKRVFRWQKNNFIFVSVNYLCFALLKGFYHFKRYFNFSFLVVGHSATVILRALRPHAGWHITYLHYCARNCTELYTLFLAAHKNAMKFPLNKQKIPQLSIKVVKFNSRAKTAIFARPFVNCTRENDIGGAPVKPTKFNSQSQLSPSPHLPTSKRLSYRVGGLLVIRVQDWPLHNFLLYIYHWMSRANIYIYIYSCRERTNINDTRRGISTYTESNTIVYIYNNNNSTLRAQPKISLSLAPIPPPISRGRAVYMRLVIRAVREII